MLHEEVADAVLRALRAEPGSVLVFLPGAREIEEARVALTGRIGDADVMPLHGSLPADQQDAVLQPAPRRRVVLATNIAETSLTVPRVRAVVDAGLQKVARYDAERGLDRLVTERITADAATQRAGRAGRLGPGLAIRLWPAHDRLRPFREPEIRRVDLAPLLLAVLAWGSLDHLRWLEPPDDERLAVAQTLLTRLGLVGPEGRLTDAGRRVQRLPVHPRVGRFLLDTNAAPQACLAAAALSDLRDLRGDGATTACDLWSLVTTEGRLPRHVVTAAAMLGRRARGSRQQTLTEERFRRAVLAAWPDRVARRREATGTRVQMASGAGGVLTRDSGVHAPWLVALTARASDGPDARIALATSIDKAWLAPTSSETTVRVDADGTVRASRVSRYDALVLHEEAIAPDPDQAAGALAQAWRARPRDADDARLLARVRFAGLDVDVDALVRQAAVGCRRLADLRPGDALAWADRQRLDALAPERLPLPSGRTARLEYRPDGDVVAAAKLQELFGLADTPRLGPRQTPVLVELLAPNGRPVQTTRDLRSFWTTTYAEVRKELRGR
ncbi:MAG: ATP-dependent helicase C-terminal domain-containing protein, partial [Vicinamibacteria bacterium]